MSAQHPAQSTDVMYGWTERVSRPSFMSGIGIVTLRPVHKRADVVSHPLKDEAWQQKCHSLHIALFTHTRAQTYALSIGRLGI